MALSPEPAPVGIGRGCRPRAGATAAGGPEPGTPILETFSGQTIVDICRQTQLPAATVHRMLGTLIDWDGVERVSRGRYHLGLKVWNLGSAVP